MKKIIAANIFIMSFNLVATVSPFKMLSVKMVVSDDCTSKSFYEHFLFDDAIKLESVQNSNYQSVQNEPAFSKALEKANKFVSKLDKNNISEEYSEALEDESERARVEYQQFQKDLDLLKRIQTEINFIFLYDTFSGHVPIQVPDSTSPLVYDALSLDVASKIDLSTYDFGEMAILLESVKRLINRLGQLLVNPLPTQCGLARISELMIVLREDEEISGDRVFCIPEKSELSPQNFQNYDSCETTLSKLKKGHKVSF